jgi:hypothetical protein
MKRAEKTLEKIYERDQQTKAFIISVAIDQYVDVFNELDSAPWRRRDLDHDLRIFLEESSSDIPLKYEIVLQFNVSKDTKDADKEERIKLGLRTYFSFVRNSLQAKIRDTYQKSGLYMLASFLLLFVSFSFQLETVGNTVLTTLVNGVNIVGWVFLWEAISTFAFTSRDAREKFSHYKRLSEAEVRFTYLKSESES